MRNKHLTGVALACLLGIGLMLGGGACGILFPWPVDECRTDADCPTGQACQNGQCVAATPDCTSDTDCDDDLFCNGAETCVAGQCQPGTDPCAIGTTCNEETDTCDPMGAPSPYETNALLADFERVHGLHQAVDCAACHHAEPVDAGFGSCTTCHPDDPNEFNSFKDVAHDQNESGDGCRSCHDAEWSDNCAFCHTALLDL